MFIVKKILFRRFAWQKQTTHRNTLYKIWKWYYGTYRKIWTLVWFIYCTFFFFFSESINRHCWSVYWIYTWTLGRLSMSAMYPAFPRPTSTLPPRDARALPIRRWSLIGQTLGRRSGPLGSRRGRSTEERLRGQRTHHTGESPGKFGILHL